MPCGNRKRELILPGKLREIFKGLILLLGLEKLTRFLQQISIEKSFFKALCYLFLLRVL